MGYPSPLNPSFRHLENGIFLASTSFGILDRLHVGGRMAVLSIPNTNKKLIWSSLPMCDGFDKAMEEASLGSEFEVVAAVVPNTQHTLAAVDLKKKFPKMVLIGPTGIKSETPIHLDYEFKYEDGNKVVNGSTITPELANFDFFFLKGHKNNELVLLDKANKTLFQSDLMMNIPPSGVNQDQYPNSNQNKGLFRYITMGLNPDSWFGKYIFVNRLFRKSPENCEAIQELMSLDFDTMVLSHGNIIEKDAKKAMPKVFGDFLI